MLVRVCYALPAILACALVQGIPYARPPKSEACKYTDVETGYEGTGYKGKLSQTVSGSTCRMWSSNTTFSEEAFGPNSATEVRNYCRNPLINGVTDMPNGPWCFTVYGREYCDVPHCSEMTFRSTRQCQLENDNGFMSYAGDFTWPEKCLHWTHDAVQAQEFELWQFPGTNSWDEMADHCRNPDNDEFPWCYDKQKYEIEDELVKHYCDNITKCSTNCRLTEGSLEYVGKKDKSETRKRCIPAQNMIPGIFQDEEERRRWFEARYTNDNYYINLTQCRSYPEQIASGVNKLGPVCYVNNSYTGEVTEESCAIHYCRPAGVNFSVDYLNPYATTTEFYDIDFDIDISRFANTTKSPEYLIAANIMLNWSEYVVSFGAKNSSYALAIGVSILTVTGLFLMALMLLDCSSIHKCTRVCKRNSKEMSNRMRELGLYGSRISLRSNQVSPNASSECGSLAGKEIRRQEKRDTTGFRSKENLV